MSNKRRLRRQLAKKKQDRILATITATNNDLSLSYDMHLDKIEIHDAKIESMHHEVFYERDSGKDKILSQIPCGPDKGYLNQIASLKDNIDFLFSIDTNTVDMNGQRTSFSVCYFVPQILSMYRNDLPSLPFIAFEINEVSLKINPECIGWHLLIDYIVNNQAYNPKQRIGIAVDSELGNLKSINSRELPYYYKYYLPENIQLLYAFEKGKDYLINTMLSYCHRAAKKAVRLYKENGIKLNCRKNGDCNFRGFRHLKFKVSNK
jgi:hypothetical protein